MKFSSYSPHRRRGSVLPLVALGITVLLGAAALAVDYGVLLSDKNQLQRGCDSAALAGAGYLKRSDDTTDTNKAREEALLVAAQNNLSSTEVTAARITFLDNNTKIRVTAVRNRSLFFARILGIFQGSITATAVAVANPAAGPPVPIAISKVSKDRYQGDGLTHKFTLIRPQESAFATNYSGLTPFDPFTVFDLRGGQAKSGPQMKEQLAGDLTNPVNPQIGDTLTGMALSLDVLVSSFQQGIGPRFIKAAGSPWLDPPVNPFTSTSAWRLIGTRYQDVLSGNIPPNNPRVVRFVVLNEVNSPVSNYNYPIVDFATAYLHSVQMEPSGALTFTATFLPPGTGNASSTVALIE